jgi:hypothetical protein
MGEILRPGLLDGVCVRVERLGGAPDGGLAETLKQLGAEMRGPEEESADALVLDCSNWSPAGDQPGPAGAEPLLELLDGVWSAVLAVAVDRFIPSGHGGRILFIAPGGSVAAAALENLSRTLSVEWARHTITAVTLALGSDPDPEHLATVVAYLLSPAGAYFSGARLDLNSLRP